MDPKTKTQKIVWELCEKLGDISQQQFWQVINLFDKVSLEHKGHIKCCECGHDFDTDVINSDNTVVCPRCGMRTKVLHTTKKQWSEHKWVMITQAVGKEWQVFRFLSVDKGCHKERCNGKPISFIDEVMQLWLSDKGEKVYMAKDLCMYPNRCRNPFKSYSAMSIKIPHGIGYNCGGFDISDLRYDKCIVTSVAKWLKYRGMGKSQKDGKINGIYYDDWCTTLMMHPLYEVMFKKKMYNLIKFCRKEHFLNTGDKAKDKVHTNAMKLALKHNYFDDDRFKAVNNTYYGTTYPGFKNWADMVDEVMFLGLDWHNAHYICPADMDKQHTMLSKKVQKIKEAEEAKRKLAEALKKEQDYINKRKKFFDICITDGEIKIQVLRSVQQFAEEGKEMKHCVYGSSYFDVAHKPNSLILSARIGEDWMKPEKYLETIEVDLSDYSVAQCHGHCNQDSPYHRQILRLMRRNMNLIEECKMKKAA